MNAELRLHGPPHGPAVICVNGGRSKPVAGTWSASLEWLVARLAPQFPQLRFAEVKYRIKSWNHFDSCIEDARQAIERVGAERTLLLGFSMGGAVSISVADDPRVEAVLGLAPWIPDQLPVEPLRGRRLDVVHGSLDRSFPGIPGVSPASSHRGFERAQALGVPGRYTLIPGALHAIALRAGSRPVPLPRARSWLSHISSHLEPFACYPGDNRSERGLS
jgi:pimeloyl-ACP methyl ester carboxylesterase